MSAGAKKKSRRRRSLRSTAARNRIVEENLPLVGWVVNRYSHTRQVKALGNDDAIAAGYCGLIRAAELFDESRGFVFATYAVPWIWQAIDRHAQDAYLIPIPHYRRQRGENPPMCHFIGDCPKKDLDNPDPYEPATPEPQGLDFLVSARVQRALKSLDRRSRDIIRRRFWKGELLEEIGNRYGITREGIRQIQNKALEALRKKLAGKPK